MMKILFVDSHKDVQQTWVDPLRSEGWGVVLAHSVEEASKLMLLHGDGIEALVVHEKFVGFAEQQSQPFLVLTESWSEKDILRHQNSPKSARGYITYKGSHSRVMSFWSGAPKETGTRSGIKLVEATQFLKRPESTRTRSTASLSLKSPTKSMSGRTTNTQIRAIREERAPVAQEVAPEVSPVQEVNEIPIDQGSAAVDFDSVEPTRIQALPREAPAPEPVAEAEAFAEAPESTRMIDRTTINRTTFNSPGRISPAEERDDLYSYDTPVESIRDEVDSYFSSRPPEPRPALKLVSEANPDVETLRNYLAMREQDVAVLSGQVRSSKERLSQVEAELKEERARNLEIQALLSKAEQTIKNYDLEKRVEMEVVEKQVEDLDRQLKDRTDKARVIETRLRLMNEEVNKVKERVRVDIRRIRVREKELEGQLEILKKDSAALLQARDEKILELKRRVDLLEFNMELAQEQYEKERRSTDELRTKLRDAADAVKQANGYLEQ